MFAEDVAKTNQKMCGCYLRPAGWRTEKCPEALLD